MQNFKFKQFEVAQQEGVFKVGTDALLLGAWTDVVGAKHILDIGTGTGVIALMLAQRCSAQIDSVEINPEAAELAQTNFTNSPWRKKLAVHQKSLQAFSVESSAKYDLIVSNPPYFNRSLRSANEAKNLARHTQGLKHNELLQHSIQLLAMHGRLTVILPVDEGKQLIKEAELCELFLQKITHVHPHEKKSANRLLLEFGRKGAQVEENDLFIRNSADLFYTQQYICLTRDFHTIF